MREVYAIPSHLLLPFSLLYWECGNFLLRLDWILATTRDFRKEAALKSATNLWLYSRMTPASFFVSLRSSDTFQMAVGNIILKTGFWILKRVRFSKKFPIFSIFTNSLPLLGGFVSLCMLINAKIMFLWYSEHFIYIFTLFKNLTFKQNLLTY